MKHALIFALCPMFVAPVQAVVNMTVSAVITITNAPTGTNGEMITMNGAVTNIVSQ